jgi:hypothetical protein
MDADEKRLRNNQAVKAYRDRNRELLRERWRSHYRNNADEINKRRREAGYTEINAKRRRQRASDPKAAQAARDAVARSRKKHLAKHRAKDAAKYRRGSPEHKLKHNSLSIIRQSLTGRRKNKPWHEAVGYTVEELRSHLERQFTKGMSWENYGEWHVDHIIPVTAFNYDSVDHPEFKVCWALTNLRPLWAEQNISKNNRRIHLI